MNELQTKIDTLSRAIESPATPEPQRVIMRRTIDKLEEQLEAFKIAEQKAQAVTAQILPIINGAYVMPNTRGFCEVTPTLSQDGTEITLTIKGESPITDKEDEKIIIDAVIALKHTTHEIILQEPSYQGTATVDICSVKIADTVVTGKVFLKLDNSLND